MSLKPDILDYFDTEVRKRKSILASDYRCEFSGGVRRTVGPFASASHNWIDHCEITATEVAESIAKQVDFFKSIGHAFRWKVYSHDHAAQLSASLLERGFTPWEPCALMILDVGGFQSRFPDGIEYRRLTDPDALPRELQPVMETVWDEGADELISALRGELRDMGDHMRIHVAKRGGATIGCGLIRYNERKTFGGLFAGATVPAERGGGVYRGMVAARVEDVRQAKANYIYTEAGSMSRPILERIGFETVATITNYVFDPCGTLEHS